MKQQINLYQPMFRKQEKVFSAVTMLQIIVFFTVILIGIYAYSFSQLQPFHAELDKTLKQFDKLSKQIEIIAQALPRRAESKLIVNEIARLTKELQHRQKVKDALSKGSFGSTDGFSGYFEALAKGHIGGIWLTGIHIAQGGALLSFNGKSIDPELIPVYLKRLSKEPVFNNRAFNILEMQRAEAEPELLLFNVATGG